MHRKLVDWGRRNLQVTIWLGKTIFGLTCWDAVLGVFVRTVARALALTHKTPSVGSSSSGQPPSNNLIWFTHESNRNGEDYSRTNLMECQKWCALHTQKKMMLHWAAYPIEHPNLTFCVLNRMCVPLNTQCRDYLVNVSFSVIIEPEMSNSNTKAKTTCWSARICMYVCGSLEQHSFVRIVLCFVHLRNVFVLASLFY